MDLYQLYANNDPRSQTQYSYFESRLLYEQKQYKSAYEKLKALYDRQQLEWEATAKSRTYAIARFYDVEREQEKNKLLSKQHKLTVNLIISYIVLSLLIGGLLSYTIVFLHRKRRYDKEQYDKQVKDLRNLLSEKQELMQSGLQHKLQICRKVKLLESAGKIDELPQWGKEMLDSFSFINDEQMNELVTEFNTTFSGYIDHIRQRYPSLTETDIRWIVLVSIGASNEDIAILLHQEPRTVWTRRQRVKKKISDIENCSIDDIDNWIYEQAFEHVMQAYITPRKFGRFLRRRR